MRISAWSSDVCSSDLPALVILSFLPAVPEQVQYSYPANDQKTKAKAKRPGLFDEDQVILRSRSDHKKEPLTAAYPDTCQRHRNNKAEKVSVLRWPVECHFKGHRQATDPKQQVRTKAIHNGSSPTGSDKEMNE